MVFPSVPDQPVPGSDGLDDGESEMICLSGTGHESKMQAQH